LRSSARSFVATALALPILALGCAWGGGDEEDDGECNPTCLAECRSQCTNSVDAEGYDECSEMCDCGCD
jgi:hypothetical protein